MHSLKPITALGRDTARVDTIGTMTITERPDVALASVTARLNAEKKSATAFKKATGLAFPVAMASTTKSGMTAYWTGPNQCMLEAPFDSHETLAVDLASTLTGIASVTEQSDGWVRFDLAGTACHDVFERLCAVDTRNMDTGAVQRTTVEHLGSFVVNRGDNMFSITAPRSSADSLHHALILAAKSVA